MLIYEPMISADQNRMTFRVHFVKQASLETFLGAVYTKSKTSFVADGHLKGSKSIPTSKIIRVVYAFDDRFYKGLAIPLQMK